MLQASTWQSMPVDQLMPHIPYMQGHFQVEWNAAQSMEEVLLRDEIQFPSFVRQMSRVG